LRRAAIFGSHTSTLRPVSRKQIFSLVPKVSKIRTSLAERPKAMWEGEGEGSAALPEGWVIVAVHWGLWME